MPRFFSAWSARNRFQPAQRSNTAITRRTTVPENAAAEPHAQEFGQPEPNGDTPVADGDRRFRLAVWFSVRGPLRFLSHRDTMRLWHKALVRAALPLRYTQGFNRRSRLSLPLPRSVGMAAQQELLLIELTRKVPPEQLMPTIQAQLPQGLEITAALYAPADAEPRPTRAEYRIVLRDHVDCQRLQQRIEEFTHSPSWPVQRPRRGRHPPRTIDLCKSVTALALCRRSVHCTIAVRLDHTPRIEEIRGMLGIEQPNQVRRLCRVATGYPPSFLPPQRTNNGHKEIRGHL